MTVNEKPNLKQRRLERLSLRVMMYKKELAERLRETKSIFGKRVFAVDIHTHSNYSDGLGSPAENHECARNAGLDFLFVTDHESVMQKRQLAKLADASWGQEPGAGLHHIGLLNNARCFRPARKNIGADFAKARRVAPFAWIPHPAGWYPSTWYNDEQVASLWSLGEKFAMEVVNGANKVAAAYDAFDAEAVRIWDRLLRDGRQVTALGGSDAHIPEDIGSVWTGVFADELNGASIIAALQDGNCFASEAALMYFSCNGLPMGSRIMTGKGTRIRLKLKVADAAGIASCTIVSNGKILKRIDGSGRTSVEEEIAVVPDEARSYYRLESISGDGRRAFSSPVYVSTG